MMFFGLLFILVLAGSALFVLLIPAFTDTDALASDPGQTREVEGTLADLSTFISELMTATAAIEAESNDLFLVGTISATEDFLQFTADGREVLLDFPLITIRQKEFEEKVKAVCREVGIKPAAYIHSNPDKIGTSYGEDRLAYVINGSTEEVSAIITEIYNGIFEIDSMTTMRFEKNGF